MENKQTHLHKEYLDSAYNESAETVALHSLVGEKGLVHIMSEYNSAFHQWKRQKLAAMVSTVFAILFIFLGFYTRSTAVLLAISFFSAAMLFVWRAFAESKNNRKSLLKLVAALKSMSTLKNPDIQLQKIATNSRCYDEFVVNVAATVTVYYKKKENGFVAQFLNFWQLHNYNKTQAIPEAFYCSAKVN